MIGWVDGALKRWGEAKRRINDLRDKPLTKRDDTGITKLKTMASGNARSFMGRLDEGGHVGKGKDQITLSAPPEVYYGEALIAAVAINLALENRKLSEDQYNLLFVHYAIKAKLDKKIRYIGCSRKTYFSRLGMIHRGLCSHLSEVAKRHEESGTCHADGGTS